MSHVDKILKNETNLSGHTATQSDTPLPGTLQCVFTKSSIGSTTRESSPFFLDVILALSDEMEHDGAG